MTMDEQWQQQMRQKMADYQWPGPELSWEELDHALTAGKTRKVGLLRRWTAAAVLLLIGGVGYWAFSPRETEQDASQTLTQVRSTENLQGEPPIGKSFVSNKIAQFHQTSEVLSVSTADADTIGTAEPTEKEQDLPQSDNQKPQSDTQKTKAADQLPPVVYPSDLRRQSNKNHRLTAQVYMSSTMSGSQTGFGQYPGVVELNPYGYSSMAKLRQEVHHRQPLRFGLSLRYRLDDRWSLESGLSYTRLSSDITMTADGVTNVTEQRLNYIGLPLNVSYDLWKSRRFGLYVSAGGMIEKQLEGSPWQFSLNGAAGAEYRLTDFLSLYAEPGFGYYFKDGSSIPTIYKDRPLNFNLSFGLRFNLNKTE